MSTNPPEPKKDVVLHIRVPGIWADDLDESAALWADGKEPTPEDYLNVVIEEWLKEDVGITVVTHPSEKSTNDDFGIHAYNGRIVGAHVVDRDRA